VALGLPAAARTRAPVAALAFRRAALLGTAIVIMITVIFIVGRACRAGVASHERG
jgi:hypothetical protein